MSGATRGARGKGSGCARDRAARDTWPQRIHQELPLETERASGLGRAETEGETSRGKASIAYQQLSVGLNDAAWMPDKEAGRAGLAGAAKPHGRKCCREGGN